MQLADGTELQSITVYPPDASGEEPITIAAGDVTGLAYGPGTIPLVSFNTEGGSVTWVNVPMKVRGRRSAILRPPGASIIGA
jgi:hypothetical protein